jgi:hypothetical protein
VTDGPKDRPAEYAEGAPPDALRSLAPFQPRPHGGRRDLTNWTAVTVRSGLADATTDQM